MRSVHTDGSTQDQRSRIDSAGLVREDTGAEEDVVAVGFTPFTFLHPFAPLPLQELPRYYGCSDSCPGLHPSAGLPASRTRPSRPFRLQPLRRSPPSLVRCPKGGGWRAKAGYLVEAGRCPADFRFFTPAGLARTDSAIHSQARRVGPAESSSTSYASDVLRTGLSPPAASHPASRRRSCSRLLVGERIPGEDSHLPDPVRSQAHECASPACTTWRSPRRSASS